MFVNSMTPCILLPCRFYRQHRKAFLPRTHKYLKELEAMEEARPTSDTGEKFGQYEYFTRLDPGRSLANYYRRHNETGQEELLLDTEEEGKGSN